MAFDHRFEEASAVACLAELIQQEFHHALVELQPELATGLVENPLGNCLQLAVDQLASPGCPCNARDCGVVGLFCGVNTGHTEAPTAKLMSGRRRLEAAPAATSPAAADALVDTISIKQQLSCFA